MKAFRGKVEKLSKKGMGVVSHADGKQYFVQGTWPGDEGLFEIIDRKHKNKKFGYAKIVVLEKVSEGRTECSCAHLGVEEGKCQGCPWMMASYQSQLEQKTEKLKYALSRFGPPVEIPYKEIISSPKTLGYKNRIQIKTDGEKIGFVSQGTKTLAPIDDCLVANEKVRELLKNLKSSLPNQDWVPSEGYDWNFIDLDDEMNVCDVQLNTRRPFKQGNDGVNAIMKEWLESKLKEISKENPVLELFCGAGNFTEIISDCGFQNVLALEANKSSIEKLTQRDLKGVRAEVFDLYRMGIGGKLKKLFPKAEVMVLDPPRNGLKSIRSVVKNLKGLKEILYVSCEMDTFARDAKFLAECDFNIEELQPVDQFPHTPHVEILAHFKKGNF